MRLEELKHKEVINNCDCKILGFVKDIEFNICTGCIEAIIVSGPTRFCGLICCDYEYVIPHKCIEQVGPDIIMVKIDEKEAKKKVSL